jgi:hypothetical protein
MLPLPKIFKNSSSTPNSSEYAAAKSSLFNIFRANYWQERFYGDALDILAANHCEFKDLATKSGEKFNPDSGGSNRLGVTNVG